MCIDFRLKKMMIVEIVLVISDENRAFPSWKGSKEKPKLEVIHQFISPQNYGLFCDNRFSLRI